MSTCDDINAELERIVMTSYGMGRRDGITSSAEAVANVLELMPDLDPVAAELLRLLERELHLEAAKEPIHHD